jgi:outer membrane protein assembly factor BamB
MILFTSIFTFLIVAFVQAQDYEKLPNCVDNSVPGLVLVSTIDGKLSAVTSEGTLKWQIDTDPGPLLVSNIHNLEVIYGVDL